jgi:hypothetical protein
VARPVPFNAVMSTPETPPPAGGDPGPGGLSGIQRASIVLGALAVLLIVFVVLRGGDDSGDSPSSSAPPTTAQSTAESTDSQATDSTATGGTGSTATGETGDDSSTGTTSESGADSTTTAAPAPEIQTVRVVDGKPQGGVKTLSFKKDDQVRFKVQSDTADEIHVHGYDLMKDVEKGGSVQFSFKGDIEGRFEVELENAGVQIANLEVTPS